MRNNDCTLLRGITLVSLFVTRAVGAASHQGRAGVINYSARAGSLVPSYVMMKNVKISEVILAMFL